MKKRNVHGKHCLLRFHSGPVVRFHNNEPYTVLCHTDVPNVGDLMGCAGAIFKAKSKTRNNDRTVQQAWDVDYEFHELIEVA